MRKRTPPLAATVSLLLGIGVASAQGVNRDEAPAAPVGSKHAQADQRGPGGFSPQESSPANGGINLRSTAESKSAHSETTGQGSAAGAASLSVEQRGRITAIFRRHKVTPAHLDVPVHLGTRVPPSVRHYPMPAEVAEIYPEWRDYDYIMAGNEILIIDPDRHEVVAIVVV